MSFKKIIAREILILFGVTVTCLLILGLGYVLRERINKSITEKRNEISNEQQLLDRIDTSLIQQVYDHHQPERLDSMRMNYILSNYKDEKEFLTDFYLKFTPERFSEKRVDSLANHFRSKKEFPINIKINKLNEQVNRKIKLYQYIKMNSRYFITIAIIVTFGLRYLYYILKWAYNTWKK